ncbi:ankyrin-2 isoform X2 [Larimichthys crocea]|uniref:ankyrin-2 isoform X2 n=1 Tax=Larimichthys crocea TaxID=215358 RepID=UPI000F5D8B50|nr:ankyrin-2 isoform X2 [Larimichthys crocea]
MADDSVTNPIFTSSPSGKSFFGEGVSPIGIQMRDDDLSPESPKHEGMAVYSKTSVGIRTHRSSSGESEGPTVTHQMTNEMSTFSTSEVKYVISSQEEKLYDASQENTTINESKVFLPQTDAEVTEIKIEEPQFQEVHIERKTSTQESTAVKDMSGMVSLMNSDLDQYLQARPLASWTPEEDIAQEKFEQIIITKDKDKEILTFVTDENKGAMAGDTTQEIDHAPTEHSTTWGGEDVESEDEEETKETSVMNTDLDQFPETVKVKFDDVQEKFDISTSFTDESKDEVYTTQETDGAEVKHEVTRRGDETAMDFTESQATLTEELPMREEWVERTTSYQLPTKVKEMSGMLSLLSSDLDKYLEDRPVKSRTPEEDIIQERFEQVTVTKIRKSSNEEQTITICEKTQTVASADAEDKISGETHEQTDVVELKERTPSSVVEIPFKEVCVSKKTYIQSKTEKDMSGMSSLLNTDLDQYLKERPMEIQCHPQEDLVHERYEQVIVTSRNLEDKIGVEENEPMQTNEVEVRELSPISVLETPFQEVHIERKTQQQQSSIIERDLSGMLALLSCDLDQHLKKEAVVIQCQPEEEVVHESYKEVILTKDTKKETLTFSPEHKEGSPEDTNVDIVDSLEGGLQICSHEDEGPKSLSPEEDEAKLSPSAGSPFSDSIEGPDDITKSFVTTDDSKNDSRDASVIDAQSVLKTHEFLQQPSSSITLQRPDGLRDLNAVVFDDPTKESCQPDSLEASPIKEDRSSKTSPDSIEPSPTRESPCPDSLEVSPTQSKELPAKTAVYEDYASQLEACFAYDKNIYRDESDHDEQENNYGSIQMDKEFKYSYSAEEVTDGNKCSDLKKSDSENLHILIRQDSLDALDSDDDTTNKQFTPEEEMFKMAAKIKTFDEMEHEAKIKKDKSLDATALSEADDYKDDELELKCGSDIHPSSQDTLQRISETCATESTHTLSDAIDISSSIKENVEIESQPEIAESVDDSLCLTETHREGSDVESEGTAPLLTEREAEIYKDKDAVEGFPVTHAHFSSSVTDEHYPDDNKEVESPLTDGSGSEPQTMVCTEELEHVSLQDEAFNAQVEPEEQINRFPAEDRNTPEKTPIRTPGDERSPDPFQFQEGKLFEMTRGGAIDMTRRTFDEEEEGYAFFHIGDHPVDEVVPEETGEGQAKYLTSENSDSIADTTLQEVPQSSLAQDANDIIPTAKPRTLIEDKSEIPLSEVNLGSSVEVQIGSPSALERLTITQSEAGALESLGLDYLDSTIADLQSDTVAHSVYLEQGHESSDSSPDDDDEEEEDEEDDQCSVIEMSSSAALDSIPAYHRDSPPPLPIKPGSTTEEEMVMEDSLKSDLDQVQTKAEKGGSLDRRTRSEADSDTSKTSNKGSRSYSDGSQPTDESNLFPSKPPVMTQEKPLAQTIPFSSSEIEEIQLSTETSVRSSLDTDDISSSSHRSPDSVIFTYDIPASHSSDSDGKLLPGVQPSSGTEDVFQSKPAQDDTVETEMQRIIDDQTPGCTPVDWQDDADRKEETLAIIADLLGFSWTELARELEFSEDDIQLVRTENPNSLQEQSHALLQRWVEREGKHATENCLIKRLTKINRMDIVHLIETQMNKSVQEQTSRTYAEIEKTLDHSEVSVALSSVQEDAESPRVVRRVESDRRPPPAVSEEDLSVASLLDIPSWAEPIGHTHSESMHGDLLDELEIPHELNPNLWTSEDVITQEPTMYDNSDEQGDEMLDLPTQSVTEERYQDENGHIVVKKVTRKIIRKCVSADGVEHEQVSLEGAPQGSISTAEGDGYSKVVKRTVVKSEGDHAEVTFAEGFSASRQETTGSCKVSRVERTTVVEGERTMTHQGDPSLASDLPSAQDDFKQGPHA